jgi:uncharacterized protein (DUF2147 family)
MACKLRSGKQVPLLSIAVRAFLPKSGKLAVARTGRPLRSVRGVFDSTCTGCVRSEQRRNQRPRKLVGEKLIINGRTERPALAERPADSKRAFRKRRGAALCATIAKPKSSVDPQTGLPWTDKNNPDPAHRGRPLIGVPVLYGLVPDGPGRWSGRLYSIDNSNSYTGHLLEIDPRTIRVEGCAIGICGGQNMTRIR